MSIEPERSRTKTDHPVLDVYKEFMTARYNVRYFEKRISTLRRWNFSIEFTVALSVPAIAGLWIWSTTIGSIFWQILIAIAAILSVIKPLVRLSDKIQEVAEVLTKWRVLDGEYQRLSILISQRRRYDREMREQFLKLLDIKTTIKDPQEEINTKLSEECYKKVGEELPLDSFFIPSDIDLPEKFDSDTGSFYDEPQAETPEFEDDSIEPPKPW
jgi:hypothetical protein